MTKGGANEANEEEKQEMGELVESDPELYQCDDERDRVTLMGARGGNKDLGSFHDKRVDFLDDLYGGDSDGSFMSDEEQKARVKSRKEVEVKLNNSYTGPYPSDPTDFNHSDKGLNAQFLHFLKTNA